MDHDAFLQHGHIQLMHVPSRPSNVYPLCDYRSERCSADVERSWVATQRSSAELLYLASVHDSE
jgi:hypothetical protein